MVAVGSAITCVPVDELRLEAGLHVYVVAPLAINPMVSPPQMDVDTPVMETDTVGVGLTVIVILSLLVQPLADVPVTT